LHAFWQNDRIMDHLLRAHGQRMEMPARGTKG
jgi:hypothetical protein